MELHRVFDPRAWNKTILEKLSRVSKARETSKSGSQKMTLQGIFLIFLGLILSYTAYQWSFDDGEHAYDQKTWPHEKAWIAFLKEARYTSAPVSENSALLQTHPAPYVAKTEVWLRGDQKVIYLGQSPYHVGQPELWVRENTQKGQAMGKSAAPINWIHLGSGIRAFNELVAQIQKEKTPVLKRNWVDPKEIRY